MPRKHTKFIMKQLKNRIFLKIVSIFVVWRLLLFITLLLAISFIHLFSHNFLGGGVANYQRNPYLLSWANFDGEHYLSIASKGYYAKLEQAFFPVYPMLIRFLAQPFSLDLSFLALVGFTISNLSLIAALFLLWRLVAIDYSPEISWWTVILLIIFPTSFYLGSVYSESLFLLLSIGSFFCARKKKWAWASILGAFASATRIFGIILLPALLIEGWQQKIALKKFLWLLLIPCGLGLYMYQQYLTVGDPLAFYHLQLLVGQQHQFGIIILPQVFFRYIKILFALSFKNSLYQTIILEFLVGVVFLLLPIYGYFKNIRLSYIFYSLVGFLLPTIQGSFSSVPRYVLVFFPSFLALAIFVSNTSKLFKSLYLFFSILYLIIESALFLRGYWVA